MAFLQQQKGGLVIEAAHHAGGNLFGTLYASELQTIFRRFFLYIAIHEGIISDRLYIHISDYFMIFQFRVFLLHNNIFIFLFNFNFIFYTI